MIEFYPQSTKSYSPLDFTGPIKLYQNAGFEEVNRYGKTNCYEKETIKSNADVLVLKRKYIDFQTIEKVFAYYPSLCIL